MVNNHGFTLTEALISLAITSILTSFSLPSLSRFYDHFQLNQAVAVLQSDLHRVRDYNMVPSANGESKSLVIDHADNSYAIILGNQALTRRRLPSRVTIPGDGSTRLTFTATGNISRAGTLTVASRYHTRRLVFSIGIGGFDVRD